MNKSRHALTMVACVKAAIRDRQLRRILARRPRGDRFCPISASHKVDLQGRATKWICKVERVCVELSSIRCLGYHCRQFDSFVQEAHDHMSDGCPRPCSPFATSTHAKLNLNLTVAGKPW